MNRLDKRSIGRDFGRDFGSGFGRPVGYRVGRGFGSGVVRGVGFRIGRVVLRFDGFGLCRHGLRGVQLGRRQLTSPACVVGQGHGICGYLVG